MTITLRTLLASAALNLTTVGPTPAMVEQSGPVRAGLKQNGPAPARPASDGDTPVAWVAVTELEDPRPFLSGREVVLTTGLRLKTISAQRNFVRRVASAGALALGFGVGLGYLRVPTTVIEEATIVGLPVFEVPYETPFMAIGKLVADAQSAAHYERLEALLRGHQVLAAALLGGNGLPRLLEELAGMLDTDVMLFQYGTQLHGTELSPRGRGETPARPDGDARRWHKVPIATGLKDRCTLAIAEPFSPDAIIDYAQSLVSLELSNQATLRSRSRAANGQLLADVIAGVLTGQDAELRLAAAGVDVSDKLAVLIVDVASGQRRALPTLPMPDGFAAAVTALVQDRLVVISADGANRADQLSSYLYNAGLTAQIGTGGTYAKPSGLRWSYFEARESLARGKRVNPPNRLSLTSLLLASADVPLGDLATEALNPLLAFDEKHDAELLATLETYLEHNGSVAAVAEAMALHRNTVRYRLQQVAELSGYDPAVTAERVHLYLALRWLRLG